MLVAFYIPPQSEAGNKTALNELYSAISKQENAHPEAALLVGTLMQGNINPFDQISICMLNVQPEDLKTLDHLYFIHREHTKLPLALHLANLTIIIFSWFLLTIKN